MLTKLIAGALGAAAVSAAVTLAPSASADYYNQDTVGQFVTAVNQESARYSTGPVSVYVDYISDERVIAQTNGQVITLNSQWAALSPGQFNASIADDIASGFTPGGCGGIQATAIHEMGHVIDRLGGRAARRVVSASASNIGTSDLHGYAFDEGSLNVGEAVAISFQAVECGSATFTEQQIYDVMFS